MNYEKNLLINVLFLYLYNASEVLCTFPAALTGPLALKNLAIYRTIKPKIIFNHSNLVISSNNYKVKQNNFQNIHYRFQCEIFLSRKLLRLYSPRYFSWSINARVVFSTA